MPDLLQSDDEPKEPLIHPLSISSLYNIKDDDLIAKELTEFIVSHNSYINSFYDNLHRLPKHVLLIVRLLYESMNTDPQRASDIIIKIRDQLKTHYSSNPVCKDKYHTYLSQTFT